MKNTYNDWKTQTACEIPNEQNPYDNAGKQHNDLMAEIETQGNPEMTLDEVFELSDAVLNESFAEEIIPNFSSKEFAMPIINFSNDDEFREYINSLEIDETQTEKLFQLFDIMFQYNSQNLCDIIEDIKIFENDLLDNYESESMINVLVASSIGRFSFAYWNDRVQEDSNLTAKKGFWKKLFAGIADAIGGAAGAVAGAATVVGAIGGGVVGGIAASTGFVKVWDIFAE